MVSSSKKGSSKYSPNTSNRKLFIGMIRNDTNMYLRNLHRRISSYGIILVLLAGVIMYSGFISDSSKVMAQQENKSSVPHSAKGHENHQVIIFQNSTDGIKYSGTLSFNLSKVADIISFDDMTGKDTSNFSKIWYSGDKELIPTTLLKNVTDGTVDFKADGILAHSTEPDPYSSLFMLSNITALQDINKNISDGISNSTSSSIHNQ